jgi:hypothetical protein
LGLSIANLQSCQLDDHIIIIIARTASFFFAFCHAEDIRPVQQGKLTGAGLLAIPELAMGEFTFGMFETLLPVTLAYD